MFVSYLNIHFAIKSNKSNHTRIDIINTYTETQAKSWRHSSALPLQINYCLPSLAPGFNLWARLTWHCVGIFIASLLVNSLNYAILSRVPAQSSIWMLLLQSACINNVSSQEEPHRPMDSFWNIRYILACVFVWSHVQEEAECCGELSLSTHPLHHKLC